MGQPIILENVGEQLDPILDSILLKDPEKKMVKFGDNLIDYASDFKMYLTSRHANPHYLPEISTKIQLINFSITFEGLQEQLLNLVVNKENIQLSRDRENLIMMQHQQAIDLRDAEAEILDVLRRSTGNILENEDAAKALKES
jgi:dynein heavy chain